MSWSNPTPEEAQEAYDDAKSKYESAAEDYFRYKNEYETYDASLSSAKLQQNAATVTRDLYQKRLEALDDIIKMLQPMGDMDMKVLGVTTSAQMTEMLMKGSIYCDGVNAPSIGDFFRSYSVANNTHSAQALELIKKERNRTQINLDEAQARMNSVGGTLEELISKGQAAYDSMNAAQKTMKSCAYEMEHYKKYLD